jgi:transcription initiation factor TFIID subunit 11
MLMEFMTPAQADRYATYRRIRLKRETVRKLVNQTLSQSVPQPVIIAVTSYTKSFIGELIDRALTVRDERAVVATHLPNGLLPPAVLAQSLQRPSAHIKVKENKPTNQDCQQAGVWLEGEKESIWREVDEGASLQERLRGGNKGPLTPACLREALRRYKRIGTVGARGLRG